MVPLSLSRTLLVRNEAPMVEVVVGGLKVPFTYRLTNDVLPTPCAGQPHMYVVVMRQMIAHLGRPEHIS